MRRIALAVAAAIAGCGPAIPAVPSKGGPAWHELTSEHFTLWTDASESTARELVRHMEDLRQAVVGIGFRRANASGRSLVVALRDDDEVQAFMPRGDFAAIASPSSSVVAQPMILLSANPEHDPKGEIAAHELTHTISASVIRDQPRWFAEGLAKFFETIEIDRGRGTIDLGRAPTYRGEPLVMHHMTSLAKLFACKDLGCADASFYVTAWALFTYLFNKYPQQLTQYEDRLAAGTPDRTTAWASAFGGISNETLEQEMRDWLRSGSHLVLHFTGKLPEPAIHETTLGDADVHAARAVLRLEFQGLTDAAKIEIEAALAVDRTNVLARFLAYQIDRTIDVSVAREIAAAHPDDWHAWFLVAKAASDDDEVRAAMAKTCTLIGANPAIVPPWQPCPQ